MSSQQQLQSPLWAAVVNALPVYVGLLTRDGVLIDVNDTALADFGVAREEAIGRHFEHTAWWPRSPVARERLSESILRAMHGERVSYETVIHTQHGPADFQFSLAPIRNDRGAVEYLVASAVDVSSRVTAEEKLRRTEHRLAVAIRTSPVVVAVQDRELRYEWVHNAPYGRKAADVIGKTDHDLWERREDADRIAAVKREVVRTGKRRREDVRVLMGGHECWFDLNVDPLLGKDDQVIAITCTATDITELKLARLAAERRTLQQAFVAELGQIALTANDIDVLLDRACKGIRDLLQMDRCTVYEVSPGRTKLLFRCGAGWDEGSIEAVRSFPLDGSTPGAVAFRTGKAVVLGYYPDSSFAEVVQKFGAISGVSVSIGENGNAFGVLSTHSLRPRDVSEDDAAFVTSVANVLAAAVQRSRSDSELHERKTELEALIGDSPDAIARFDAHLRLTFANPAFERAFLGEEDSLARLDEHAQWKAALGESIQRRRSVTFETRTAAGATLEVRAVPEVIGSAVVAVICVGRDVTDRKQNEELLANRARRQRAIAQLGRDLLRADSSELMRDACRAVAENLSTDLVCVMAFDRERNEFTAEELYGYDPALLGTRLEVSGIGAWALQHGGPVVVEDVLTETRFQSRGESVSAGARSGISAVIPDSDQPYGVITTYSLSLRPFTSSDGDFLTSVAHLVSAAIYRRRAERRLETQRLELEELIDAAPDVITRLATDSTVLYINNAVTALGGIPAEIIGRRVADIPMPDAIRDTWLNGIRRVVETGARQAFENDALNGARIEVRLAPEFEDGKIVSVLAIARDITERERAEEDRRKLEVQLEQARRVASIGRLGTTVAHEFNNVLMSISPFAELITRSARHDPPLIGAAEHIRAAVVRGRRVTQEIMRFARPAEPSVDAVDLAGWVATSVQNLRPLLGDVDVRLELPPARVAVNIDRQLMEQVLLNLLVNARDALSGRSDGTISLLVSESHRKDGAFATIVVRDNGSGMAPEVRANIFEPFFTTKRNGTGLGLAVVKQIVESHGGSIDVTSENGRGTSFRIDLPLLSSCPQPAAGKTHPDAMPQRNVLVVEDNESVASGITGLLEMSGATVAHAATGADALHRVAAAAPDAIVLDIGLPDIDGIELFHRIRRIRPDVAIVFSTGHGDEGRLRDVLAERNVAHLTKPFDSSDLAAALGSVLS